MTPTITLQNSLYVPEFKHNFLYIGKLLDQNKLIASFDQNSCFFQDLLSNTINHIGKRFDGLYRFNSKLDFISYLSPSVNNIDYNVCSLVL